MAEETASQMTARLYEELGYQPNEITGKLFDELQVSDEARAALYPWVRDRVQHEISRLGRHQATPGQRREDRERQHREGRTTTRSQRADEEQGGLDPRLHFLDSHVPCPGAPGGMKLYRHFTVPDHEARAGMHRVNLKGAARRIAGHNWAVREIRQHEVRTLNDIPHGLLAAELPKNGVVA